jgi:hypothetical protein
MWLVVESGSTRADTLLGYEGETLSAESAGNHFKDDH